MTPMPLHLLWLIPLLPFAGFLLNGLGGRTLPRPLINAIALGCTALSFIFVLWFIFTNDPGAGPVTLTGHIWITAGTLTIPFTLYIDSLTRVMLLVVTGVGFLIHIYSTAYMEHEEGYWRFFAYLNLFMFFMLVLVLAENFLLLFVGWEGVGLASYLLIGFYYKKKSAIDAGKKAFIVNRIGDFGFLLAMLLMVAHFGSLNFSTVFTQVAAHPEWQGGFLTAIALLLALGATGKSAQIPLYVWLPDAMEGPTPVSALIHAATMVTAGIYMVARAHIIFDHSPVAVAVVAVIGAATAIFAASIGLVQTDIKRVLAYSTVSQLGYMFLACGVGAYSAAIFHLMTHAFFKALLFLAAGSVIHSLAGEQELGKMGGLRTKIPITFWTMTTGVFAIAGFFPFSGFFSKDEILYRVFSSTMPYAPLLWVVALITVLMTSFYMFRLWYLTFFGAAKYDQSLTHPHESPWPMLAPLILLAVLSFIGGWIGIPAALGGSNYFQNFLAPVFSSSAVTDANPGLERILASISLLVAGGGLYLADLLYRQRPELPAKLVENAKLVYSALLHKYWIDEIYSAVIVVPLGWIARVILYRGVDTILIEGAGKATASSALGLGNVVRYIQSGNIRSYAGWLAAGAALVVLLTLLAFTLTGTTFDFTTSSFTFSLMHLGAAK
jgi:NADH-quinone oxidoreductase subunit L